VGAKDASGAGMYNKSKRKESVKDKEKAHEKTQNVCERDAALVSSGRA
jgi:hypothetical protein